MVQNPNAMVHSLTYLSLKRCTEIEPNISSKIRRLDEAADVGIAPDVIEEVRKDVTRTVVLYQLVYTNLRKKPKHEQLKISRMMDTTDECFEECIRLLEKDGYRTSAPEYKMIDTEDFESTYTYDENEALMVRMARVYESQPDDNQSWEARIYKHVTVYDIDDNIISSSKNVEW